MRYLTHGRFGIVLGIGGAAAITQAYAGNPVVAVGIAGLSAIVALLVFLTVDRAQRS